MTAWTLTPSTSATSGAVNVRLGGEAKAKEAGKMRLVGKEYIVKDGDVMHFRFNV